MFYQHMKFIIEQIHLHQTLIKEQWRSFGFRFSTLAFQVTKFLEEDSFYLL